MEVSGVMLNIIKRKVVIKTCFLMLLLERQLNSIWDGGKIDKLEGSILSVAF